MKQLKEQIEINDFFINYISWYENYHSSILSIAPRKIKLSSLPLLLEKYSYTENGLFKHIIEDNKLEDGVNCIRLFGNYDLLDWIGKELSTKD